MSKTRRRNRPNKTSRARSIHSSIRSKIPSKRLKTPPRKANEDFTEMRHVERQQDSILLARQLGVYEQTISNVPRDTVPCSPTFIFLDDDQCPQVFVDVSNPLCGILSHGITPLSCGHLRAIFEGSYLGEGLQSLSPMLFLASQS